MCAAVAADAQPPSPALSIDDLDRAIAAQATQINAMTYAFLVMVREFDERGGFLRWSFTSCAEWLHWRCDLSHQAARERVRIAHALKQLPAISAAFECGALSYSKVRALTRVAGPDTESALLEFALGTTAARVEERVRQLRNGDEASIADAAQTHAARSVIATRDVRAGVLRMSVELPLEAGDLVMQALEKALIAQDSNGPEFAGTSFQAQQADALTDIARAYLSGGGDGAATKEHAERNTWSSSGTGSTSSRTGGEDSGSSGTRSTAHDSGTGSASGGATDSGSAISVGTAAQYQVLVHVDASALAGEGGRSDLPVETVRRLSCDSSVVTVEVDRRGEPVSASRRNRTVPAAVRRALFARDRHCRFPGCQHTRFLDAHHIVHWSHGGEHTLDNLVLLCSQHHRLVHEGGYTMRRDHRNEWYFQRADGRAVPAMGYRREDMADDEVEANEANHARGACGACDARDAGDARSARDARDDLQDRASAEAPDGVREPRISYAVRAVGRPRGVRSIRTSPRTASSAVDNTCSRSS